MTGRKCRHKDDVGCVDDGVGVDGVFVIDGVGIYGSVCVYASDENVSKYEERLEKEFEECCIQNVIMMMVTD